MASTRGWSSNRRLASSMLTLAGLALCWARKSPQVRAAGVVRTTAAQVRHLETAAALARVTAAVRSSRLLRPPAAYVTAPKRRTAWTRWRADHRLNQPMMRPRRTGNMLCGVPAGSLCQSRISEAENQSSGWSAGMQTMTVRDSDTAGCSLRSNCGQVGCAPGPSKRWTAVDNAEGDHSRPDIRVG